MSKETKSLVESTTEALLGYISDHELQVGDKLPNEYELSEALSVGRSTLREAVRTLNSRNVLEVRQGAGTFISEKRGIATDPLGFGLIKDQTKMIQDLFELRYLLEPKMASLAARFATAKQIVQMNELREQIEESFQKGNQDHVRLDIALHTLIAESSGNIALLHVIPIINESIALFNENFERLQLQTETVEIHREVTAAIEAHDEMAAYDAMMIHMATNRREINHIMRERK